MCYLVLPVQMINCLIYFPLISGKYLISPEHDWNDMMDLEQEVALSMAVLLDFTGF